MFVQPGPMTVLAMTRPEKSLHLWLIILLLTVVKVNMLLYINKSVSYKNQRN